MSLNVRVITPEKIVWDADVDELILPSSTGKVGILTGHAPLVTALAIGVMKIKTDGKWNTLVLMEGFAEVENNKVIILSTLAEASNSIDPIMAKDSLEKATALVEKAATKKEKIEATLELRKCETRIEALAGL